MDIPYSFNSSVIILLILNFFIFFYNLLLGHPNVSRVFFSQFDADIKRRQLLPALNTISNIPKIPFINN